VIVLTYHSHLSRFHGYGQDNFDEVRGSMKRAVEAGRLAHYAAHPKAVDAMPEPFRSQMRERLATITSNPETYERS